MNKKMQRIALLATLIAATSIALALPAHPQKGQWAPSTDPTAKYMIDMERAWAESGCTRQPVVENILADDFQGTAPSGARYDRSEALKIDSSSNERDCSLDDAKVRFFGDNL